MFTVVSSGKAAKVEIQVDGSPKEQFRVSAQLSESQSSGSWLYDQVAGLARCTNAVLAAFHENPPRRWSKAASVNGPEVVLSRLHGASKQVMLERTSIIRILGTDPADSALWARLKFLDAADRGIEAAWQQMKELDRPDRDVLVSLPVKKAFTDWRREMRAALVDQVLACPEVGAMVANQIRQQVLTGKSDILQRFKLDPRRLRSIEGSLWLALHDHGVPTDPLRISERARKLLEPLIEGSDKSLLTAANWLVAQSTVPPSHNGATFGVLRHVDLSLRARAICGLLVYARLSRDISRQLKGKDPDEANPEPSQQSAQFVIRPLDVSALLLHRNSELTVTTLIEDLGAVSHALPTIRDAKSLREVVVHGVPRIIEAIVREQLLIARLLDGGPATKAPAARWEALASAAKVAKERYLFVCERITALEQTSPKSPDDSEIGAFIREACRYPVFKPTEEIVITRWWDRLRNRVGAVALRFPSVVAQLADDIVSSHDTIEKITYLPQQKAAIAAAKEQLVLLSTKIKTELARHPDRVSDAAYHAASQVRLKHLWLSEKISNLPAQSVHEAPRAHERRLLELGALWPAYLFARAMLIQHNLRMCINVAKRFQNRGMILSDLIQEATRGLHRGVDGFDSKRNCRLLTAAVPWMKQAIQDALKNRTRTIREPGHFQDDRRKLEVFREEFLVENERKATRQDALNAGFSPDLVKMAFGRTASLSDEVGEGGGANEMGDVLADKRAFAPEAAVEESETAQRIREYMSTRMSLRDAQAFDLRLGITSGEPMDLKQVGALVGVSRTTIANIVNEHRPRLAEFLGLEGHEYAAQE